MHDPKVIEACAEAAHEVSRIFDEATGARPLGTFGWRDQSPEYQEALRRRVSTAFDTTKAQLAPTSAWEQLFLDTAVAMANAIDTAHRAPA